MSDPHGGQSHGGRSDSAGIWIRPVAVWAVLVLSALVSLEAAYRPLGALNAVVSLVIAAAMVILLWLFLMDLVGARVLIRLIAAAGLLWLSFMFALTFGDYLFRPCAARGGGEPSSCIIQSVGHRTF